MQMMALSWLRKPKFHSWFLFALAIFVAVIGAGCTPARSGAGAGLQMAPLAEMPAEVQQAPQNVRQAYQFALANPEVLQQIPCYCGCGSVGHTSNYDCYVKEAGPSGEVELDQHALGCSICVDITQDTMRLMQEGKALAEIRSTIDQTYAQYGPSNMP